MKKFLSMMLVMILAVSVLAGCAESGSETPSADGLPGEGLELVVYAGLMEDHAILAMREFEKATGVKVDMVRMSGGEIFARIKAERRKSDSQHLVWRRRFDLYPSEKRRIA